MKKNTEILLNQEQNPLKDIFTSGPAEPISSKVSRSQNLTVLSAEPVREWEELNPKSGYQNIFFFFSFWEVRVEDAWLVKACDKEVPWNANIVSMVIVWAIISQH